VEEESAERGHAVRATGWLNFNIAAAHGERKTYSMQKAEALLDPEGVTIVAEAPIVLFEPRTWKTESERFFQVFYQLRELKPSDRIPDRLKVLGAGESWRLEFSEADATLA